MSVGSHVFGDGRLGLWIINPQNLPGRLPAIKAFAGGQITDLFLPRDVRDGNGQIVYVTTKADMQLARDAGFFAHLWTTPHGLAATAYATQTLADIARLSPGAVELNVEVADAQLESFLRSAVGTIRAKKPNLRLRLNIAPFKARFLPLDLLVSDPQLYVVEQTYFGNMDGRASEDDVRLDLTAAGVPEHKGSVMFGAHVSPWPGAPRVPALPALAIRRVRRGSIYQDDLMADAGLLA